MFRNSIFSTTKSTGKSPLNITINCVSAEVWNGHTLCCWHCILLLVAKVRGPETEFYNVCQIITGLRNDTYGGGGRVHD